MNQSDPGLLLFCTCVTVPFLMGVAATLITQSRLKKMGLPWALIPGGSFLRAYLESRHE